MIDFIKAHYGKLIAFLMGWTAEAQAGLSGYLKQILAVIGIGS